MSNTLDTSLLLSRSDIIIEHNGTKLEAMNVITDVKAYLYIHLATIRLRAMRDTLIADTRKIIPTKSLIRHRLTN